MAFLELSLLVTALLPFVTEGAVQIYPDYKNHPCTRECTRTRMTCRYSLTAEWIYTMEPICGACMNGTNADCANRNCVVGDGVPKPIVAYNRMVPGPTISVCEGDTVIIDVHNDLLDVCTTMHTHGIHHRGTNHMDGVPWITQCPIHSGNTFRYRFVANPAGTHWGHSHSGYQRVTGMFFPLIVRKRREFHRRLYDFDNVLNHTISVMEFSNVLPHVANLRINRMRIFDYFLTSLLVNGVGSTPTNNVPPPVFRVTQGNRYRFRLIGAQNTVCPVEMRIDGHRFTIIASDGHDISPVTVDVLMFNPGERYDFVINANQNQNLYYIHFRGLVDCDGISGRAVLAYEDASDIFVPPAPVANQITFNCLNRPTGTPNCINLHEARAPAQMPVRLRGRPDVQIVLALNTIDFALPKYQTGFNDNAITLPVINNISWAFPSTPLIFDDGASTTICNHQTTASCRANNRVCQCTHGYSIRQGAVVEVILVDEGTNYDLSHPMHIHGTSVYVIGQDQLFVTNDRTTVQHVMQRDATVGLRRHLTRPILKDTFTIPDAGYVIVRFIADNPGYWFFHCHVEHHAEEGMNFVLRIGNPRRPPADFPKCGNYLGSRRN